MGDLDNDGDLDIYGLNWPGFDDCTLLNDGSAVFGSMATLAGSGSDDNEGDFFDYNNDGKLDIYVGNFSVRTACTATSADRVGPSRTRLRSSCPSTARPRSARTRATSTTTATTT